jgi:hypothetical protein
MTVEFKIISLFAVKPRPKAILSGQKRIGISGFSQIDFTKHLKFKWLVTLTLVMLYCSLILFTLSI